MDQSEKNLRILHANMETTKRGYQVSPDSDIVDLILHGKISHKSKEVKAPPVKALTEQQIPNK